MNPRLCVLVVVPAHNEADRIAGCLAAVTDGVDRARVGVGGSWRVVVVAHRCTDATAAIAGGFDVDVIEADGPAGKVEALRVGVAGGGDADVVVVVDADVVVGPNTLGDCVAALLADTTLGASCPPLAPLPPQRWTPLSWALWRYNRARGFSSARRWLNGRTYAVRALPLPSATETRERALQAGLAANHAFAGPLLADDVWLSRWLLRDDDSAIAHVDTAPVWYRPPATLLGMSRYGRRLRRELARVDTLYPELPVPPVRRPDLLNDAPLEDHVAWWIFRAALWWCQRWPPDGDDGDAWGVVPESKVP